MFPFSDGFIHLQGHVATSAFDCAQQVDAPKCHPNTRQAVQDDIMGRILSTETRVKWILWLKGAAGSRKVSLLPFILLLSVSREKSPLPGSFSSAQIQHATLYFQLSQPLYINSIEQIPDLLTIVIPKIQSDNLIFTKSLETSCNISSLRPLQQLHKENCLTTVVLLFDGVDECGGNVNQTLLVQLVADFFNKKNSLLFHFLGAGQNTNCRRYSRKTKFLPFYSNWYLMIIPAKTSTSACSSMTNSHG